MKLDVSSFLPVPLRRSLIALIWWGATQAISSDGPCCGGGGDGHDGSDGKGQKYRVCIFEDYETRVTVKVDGRNVNHGEVIYLPPGEHYGQVVVGPDGGSMDSFEMVNGQLAVAMLLPHVKGCGARDEDEGEEPPKCDQDTPGGIIISASCIYRQDESNPGWYMTSDYKTYFVVWGDKDEPEEEGEDNEIPAVPSSGGGGAGGGRDPVVELLGALGSEDISRWRPWAPFDLRALGADGQNPTVKLPSSESYQPPAIERMFSLGAHESIWPKEKSWAWRVGFKVQSRGGTNALTLANVQAFLPMDQMDQAAYKHEFGPANARTRQYRSNTMLVNVSEVEGGKLLYTFWRSSNPTVNNNGSTGPKWTLPSSLPYVQQYLVSRTVHSNSPLFKATLTVEQRTRIPNSNQLRTQVETYFYEDLSSGAYRNYKTIYTGPQIRITGTVTYLPVADSTNKSRVATVAYAVRPTGESSTWTTIRQRKLTHLPYDPTLQGDLEPVRLVEDTYDGNTHITEYVRNEDGAIIAERHPDGSWKRTIKNTNSNSETVTTVFTPYLSGVRSQGIDPLRAAPNVIAPHSQKVETIRPFSASAPTIQRTYLAGVLVAESAKLSSSYSSSAASSPGMELPSWFTTHFPFNSYSSGKLTRIKHTSQSPQGSYVERHTSLTVPNSKQLQNGVNISYRNGVLSVTRQFHGLTSGLPVDRRTFSSAQSAGISVACTGYPNGWAVDQVHVLLLLKHLWHREQVSSRPFSRMSRGDD